MPKHSATPAVLPSHIVLEAEKDAAPDAPAALTHIILEADDDRWLAGKVLLVDIDLRARLDVEGARYRLATEREIALAGIA